MSLIVDIKKKLGSFTLEVAFEVGNETMGLLGASGCGKSMTLRCIAGIERPDGGVIILNGKTLFDSSKGINLSPQKRKTGYLFQSYALFPNMTVEENIICGIRHVPKNQRKAIAKQHIDLLGLQGLESRIPAALSGGQQQRVALARMVASEPDVLMLDEPFSALDQFLKEQTMPSFIDILELFGKSALLVTHNMDEAYMFCPRIAVLSEGKIDTLGTRREIFQKPTTLATARLTGVKNITAMRKEDAHTIVSLDWGSTLSCVQEVTNEHTHAGIRAHYLRLWDEPENNSIACTVEQILSTRFNKSIILKPKDSNQGYLRVDTDKSLGERYLTIGETVYVEFPAEKIMMLK